MCSRCFCVERIIRINNVLQYSCIQCYSGKAAQSVPTTEAHSHFATCVHNSNVLMRRHIAGMWPHTEITHVLPQEFRHTNMIKNALWGYVMTWCACTGKMWLKPVCYSEEVEFHFSKEQTGILWKVKNDEVMWDKGRNQFWALLCSVCVCSVIHTEGLLWVWTYVFCSEKITGKEPVFDLCETDVRSTKRSQCKSKCYDIRRIWQVPLQCCNPDMKKNVELSEVWLFCLLFSKWPKGGSNHTEFYLSGALYTKRKKDSGGCESVATPGVQRAILNQKKTRFMRLSQAISFYCIILPPTHLDRQFKIFSFYGFILVRFFHVLMWGSKVCPSYISSECKI